MSSEGKEKAKSAVNAMSSDLQHAVDKSRAVDESFRSFSRMSKSHGYQEGVDAAKNYQESASLARGMGVSQSISSNQFGQYYRDASQEGQMQYAQLAGVAAKEFMPGGELHGRNRSYSGMSMGSDYGMVEALLKSSNPRHVQMGASMVGALSGAAVSSNYNEFGNLRAPSGGGLGGGGAAPSMTGPSLSTGGGAVSGGTPSPIEDPSAKVRAGVTNVEAKIDQGQTALDKAVPGPDVSKLMPGTQSFADVAQTQLRASEGRQAAGGNNNPQSRGGGA